MAETSDWETLYLLCEAEQDCEHARAKERATEIAKLRAWLVEQANATARMRALYEAEHARAEQLEAENQRLRNVAEAARVLIGLKTRLWQGPLGCWYCGHADTEGHDDRCEWALLRAALAAAEKEASGG